MNNFTTSSLKLKKRIKRTELQEQRIEKEEKKIEKAEERITKIARGIRRKFNDIMQWKQFIWTNCDYKKSLPNEQEIDYICKKTGQACHFENCPKNLKKSG